MITPQEIRWAEHIVDSSGAVAILTAGLRRDPRGRKQDPGNLRLLLIGILLSIRERRSASVADIYRTLTRDLPLNEQFRLGVRKQRFDEDGRAEGPVQVISIHAFYQLTKTITQRLSYGPATAPDIDDEERTFRRRVLQQCCDGVMDVFDFGWSSTTYAVDATGVWSWAIGRRKQRALDGAALMADSTDDEDDELLASEVTAEVTAFDRDAAWGYKTAKTKGEEVFFGYHEHTFVQVPHAGQVTDEEPRLITRFELTPANEDVCEVSLSLLDRLAVPATDLIVDRHYHYKSVDRWKDQLTVRGVRQHHDLRADEQGFTEFARMRWTAGWAHCPATPDDLRSIPAPQAKEKDLAVRAAFRERIASREAYSMRFINRPDDSGAQRLQCPALAGKIGCPLRAGTEAAAIELGIPVVANPPSAEGGEPLPSCCTQQSVKVTPPDPIRKLQQPHYWGSADWEELWRRRTYVEGSYGNRKNKSTENLSRGLFRTVGLPWLHIVMAAVNASYNLRMLRNWADRRRKEGLAVPVHLLLEPETRPAGFRYIEDDDTVEEAA